MHNRIEYSVFKHQENIYYIATESDHLVYLGWDEQYLKRKFNNLVKKHNEIHREVKRQLLDFLSGKRKKFNLKTKFYGTEFQKSVWEELAAISYGDKITYQDMAIRIGRDNSQRAVGAALGKNPIAIIYPCHRVIGKNQKLTGFAGGLKLKENLLLLESREF
jgi:O-6-methylguanine DNA methyltransferase